MRSLDAFIHHENLILFKKQLADPRIDDTRRQQLLRLLAQEDAKSHAYKRDALVCNLEHSLTLTDRARQTCPSS